MKHLTILFLDTLCGSVSTVFTTFYSLLLRNKQMLTAKHRQKRLGSDDKTREWSRISQTNKDIMVYFFLTSGYTEIIIHRTQWTNVNQQWDWIDGRSLSLKGCKTLHKKRTYRTYCSYTGRENLLLFKATTYTISLSSGTKWKQLVRCEAIGYLWVFAAPFWTFMLMQTASLVPVPIFCVYTGT